MFKRLILVAVSFIFIGTLVGKYFFKYSAIDDSSVICVETTSNSRQIDYSTEPVSRVLIKKSTQVMQLLDTNGSVVREYRIALGNSPQGHKQQEGDERTLEGRYTLDYKNENSIAYRSIHISYPNEQDKARARQMGVSAGGAIMIHGQMNGFEPFTEINQTKNWTDGCLAVINSDMDEIMDLVKVGTTIKIEW